MRVEVWTDTLPNDGRDWTQYSGRSWYLVIKEYNQRDKTLSEAEVEAHKIAEEVDGLVNIW